MLDPVPAAAVSWNALADKSLAGEVLTLAEGLAVLGAPDAELLALLHAAYRVRHRHFANRVKLNMLINAKSGHCPEDCGYCSQSKVSTAPIARYPMTDVATLVAGAREAWARGASTYCMVCSGRGPTQKTLDVIAAAAQAIKGELPLRLCACLGILGPGQAAFLRAAGIDRYNHNLNTSATHHAAIVTTHTWEDRRRTVAEAKAAGMSACSGIIIGLGESDADLVDIAWCLRATDPESIPVNFLVPIAGTPMAGRDELTPGRCLRVLALLRLICPRAEIRLAGGREHHLRSLQPLALFAANSLFVGDYLTTSGQPPADDYRMLADLGFVIDGPNPYPEAMRAAVAGAPGAGADTGPCPAGACGAAGASPAAPS